MTRLPAAIAAISLLASVSCASASAPVPPQSTAAPVPTVSLTTPAAPVATETAAPSTSAAACRHAPPAGLPPPQLMWIAGGFQTITAVDILTRKAVATIPDAGTGVFGVAVTPDGATVVVTHSAFGQPNSAAARTILLIDAHSKKIDTTIEVSEGIPEALAITPDGALAYVGVTPVPGTTRGEPSLPVLVVDLSAKKIVRSIRGVLGIPHALAITPDGAFAYVPSTLGDVYVIDTCSNEIVGRIAIPDGRPAGRGTNEGGHLNGTTFSPDGQRAYVSNIGTSTVSVIDTATRKVTATIPVGQNPTGSDVTPDGRYLYVPNWPYSINPGGGGHTQIAGAGGVSVIDTTTNALVKTIAVPNANGVATAPDGRTVWVTSGGRIAVIDVASNAVIDRIAVPGVALSSNTKCSVG